MIVFSYSPVNGEYTSVLNAQADPRNEGAWLIPAHATTIAPPEAISGYARVWDGLSWVQTEDHRGVTGWVNGCLYTICELGPFPEEWSTVPPELTIEERIANIETKYEVKFAALRVRITNVLLADGLTEDPKRTALAAEWQSEQDARDLEILELLGGM